LQRAFFLCYTSRHVTAALPVLAELRRREEWEAVLIAASSDAERALKKAQEPYLSFWAYDSTPMGPTAKRLATRWAVLQQDETFHHCLTDERGESLWSLMYPKLAELFDVRFGGGALFAERFLEAAWYTDIARALLAHLSPDLLVVMNELNVLGRATVLVARSQGVPSLHLQHGIMAEWMLWRKLHADHIAVWGEADRRRLILAGVPSERITVTGNPHFDRLTQRISPETVRALLASLGLQADRPIILVTTQHDSLEASRRQLSAVIQAATAFPEHQIVVKLHPAERFEPYRRMLRELRAPHVHLTRDVDLFALLEASAVLITRFSTTGLEAMLKKKPVITLNFSGQPDKLPYAESGAALGVHHPAQLLPALQAALENPAAVAEMQRHQERFVKEYAFRIDGQAAQRIANLMCEVARA